MITQKSNFPKIKIYFPLLLTISLLTFTGLHPILAADPFRKVNPKNIDQHTQNAFELLFKDGNYPQAKQMLIIGEESQSNDPLNHALRASLAYLDEDWVNMKKYGDLTLETATNLIKNDPLRGNLYSAVGHFLQGAYNYYQTGPISAIPKLQQVFSFLDKAEKIAPNDPELNLIKGYMDLLLATNLPFSNAENALTRLQDYGSPDYLVYRGIALAYRDLKKYDLALEYVNKSLAITPNNPEIYYLKAQILYQKAKPDNRALFKQSIDNFKLALNKSTQLPAATVKQIQYELQNAQKRYQS